ncbi:MAG: hypothetical protein IKI31_03760 [Treponema sp.]|nr:hypothetical protein [Treponema sp.]
MKKLLFATVFILIAHFSFAERYKIQNIEFTIKGMTKAKLVERECEIDKKTIFQSEDEFLAYIKDYTQRLENLRVFEKIELTYQTEKQSDDSDLNIVNIHVNAKDSFHLIAAPYPKYSSNDGFNLKVKMRDNNFFGTLQTMTFDFNFALLDPQSYTIPKAVTKNGMGLRFGGNFAFNYPFSLFGLNASWSNDHYITYTIGDKAPEWGIYTDISFAIPLHEKVKINVSMGQGFFRDVDYVPYGDAIYFGEYLSFSIPLTLKKIENLGNLTYTPSVSAKFYWDANGIDKNNTDLASPTITVEQSIGASRINWYENFRTGVSFSSSQSFSYNFLTKKLSPYFSFDFKGYKGFKHVALNTHIKYFVYANNTSNIGGSLRGIRDNAYFVGGGGKQCETPSALVMNFDMPIRLFRTSMTKGKVIPKFNFELQVSPFIDVAFLTNTKTGTTFYVKDAFYAGGIEVIMLPQKWKSIQVRGSLGVDISRILLKKWVNTDWRGGSRWELEIGIGLHY